MKRYYILILLFTIVSQSQNFQWVDNPAIVLSTNPDLVGYVVTTDHSDNIYFAGYKDTPYNYGITYGSVYFRKYNPTGAVLFSKIISGRVSIINMVSDSSDNIIVSASFVTSISIDSQTINALDSGDNQIILKFDSSGNLLWYLNINATLSGSDPIIALTTDTSNNIYIGYDDFNNSYINKISPIGTILATISQLHVNVISSVTVDELGNIYSAGGCAASNASFAGVAVNPNMTYTTYATKYDVNGVHQWTRYVQDITCSNPNIIAKNHDEIYFSSQLYGSYSFGALTSSGISSSSQGDFFIAKLNSAGVFQWVQEVPGTGTSNVFSGKRNYLNVDNQGNILFVGRTKGTINWNTTLSTTTTGNYYDGLVLKYNSSGQILMAKTAVGSLTDRFDGVVSASDGSIYISGVLGGNVNFDGITVTSSGSTNYPIIAKIGSTLSTVQNELPNFSIVRNPTLDYLEFSSSLDIIKGTIYSTLGQKIKSFETNSKIDVQNLSSGIYFLQLEDKRVFKFVKQ